ncbi:mechanosensitive ion channel family protein [Succinimonas sp.]|uniref:mechanosensitive ion channel family protein n=1 Tax=Succinimonas sp. TaxID=1936151 RepID=UPI0038692C2C
MAEETNAQEATNAKITEIIDKSIIQDPIGYLQAHQDQIISFGLDILSAAAILFVGWLIAKLVYKISYTVMTKASIEQTVSKFISNLIKYAVIAFVLTAALAQVGVQTASFVAIVGAASFAVGMALQGSLSNFASGVLLLIFRPIKVGEVVEAAGQTGSVQEITIFTTTFLTPDNKVIIIPNSSISAGTIINYSRMEKRRVDFSFGIEYGSDIKKAKEAITKMFESDERILKEDGITVVIGSLGESSINVTARVWCKGADYWDVYFDNTEKVVAALTEAGINIPFKTITVINQK